MLGAIAVSAFALLPAAAGASTKIGATDSEMNFAPTSFCSAGTGNPCSLVTTNRIGGAPAIVPGASSVLTSVRIRTRAGAADMSVRVLHNTSPSTWTNTSETTFPVTADVSVSGHVTEQAGLRMPMAPGDLLGLGYVAPAGDVWMLEATGGNEVTRKTVADHPLGASLFYGTAIPQQIQLQGTIEPDADGDGFGDETQDRCLGSKGLATGCAAKKCKKVKKKGRKRASEAKTKKKKCKKRHKKHAGHK
jgi:hypothetical protein